MRATDTRQMRPFVFEHLGHAELLVLGVPDLLPQCPTALGQPGVEFSHAAKALLARINPDAPPAVLHVLLHHPLLPAGGDVAEVGIEQVVRAHDGKAGVHDPSLAFLDLVDSGFHVVVNAPPGNAAQSCEAARVGVKQHLVTLAGVGHQPERPTGAQLHMRHLQTPVNAAHHQPLFAPVELERLAQLERQRHIGLATGQRALLHAPVANEVGQPRIAALVTGLAQLLVQRFGCAPLFLGPVRVRQQRLFDGLHERRQLGGHRPATVLRLLNIALAQVLAHRVARQAGGPHDLAHRLVLAVVHPPDLANHGHGDHS